MDPLQADAVHSGIQMARIQVFVLTLVHNRYRLDKPTLDSGKA